MNNLFKWTRGFAFLMDAKGDEGEGGGSGGEGKEGDKKEGEGGDGLFKKEFVDKVIGEKKNAMKKIDELTKQVNTLLGEKSDNEKKSLTEQGKYKELYEKSVEENTKLNEGLTGLKTKIESGVKVAALRKEFSKLGKVDDKQIESLTRLVDLNNIKYDEEHNLVFGAEDEAKKLFETFPAAFSAKDPKMKHDSAGGTTKNLTVEQWKSLTPQERAKIPLTDLYKGAGITVKK